MFCQDCVEKSVRQGGKCGLCRQKMRTRRELRRDHKVTEIIRQMVPDVNEYKRVMGAYIMNRKDVADMGLIDMMLDIENNYRGKAKKKKKLNKNNEDNDSVIITGQMMPQHLSKGMYSVYTTE